MSLFYMCLSGEKQNVKKIHATSNALLQPWNPYSQQSHSPALEHHAVAQICLSEPWCFDGFLPGHRCDSKTNKIKKLPTEIFIHSSLSAQKFVFFKSIHSKEEYVLIYPWISYGLEIALA